MIRVFDAGERWADRYSAVFDDGGALAVGETGNVPNGVCLWLAPGEFDPERLGVPVDPRVLPAPVIQAIRGEVAFEEYLRRSGATDDL